MKKAEVKRTLLWSHTWERERADRSRYTVRLTRYRLERPVVQEVRTPNSNTYETEYRIVGNNHDGDGDAIAGVFGGRWNTWDVWARAEDGVNELEDSVEGRAAAERYARRMLRAAGYRVRRAQ